VDPGDPCEAQGTTAPATDGCNTCQCNDGAWACTERTCPSRCEDGATRDAGDGCNTCSCSGGAWLCTQRACPSDPPPDPIDDPPPTGCPEPREPDPNVSCTQVEVWARSPETGLCCAYGNGCISPEGWSTFTSQKECRGEITICTPGETMNDGCNNCSCTEDGWVCTNVACPEECVPGQTRRAEDGCNVCTCAEDGTWGGCTKKACAPNESIACGGFAGDTCTDDEYCAYVEGQYCGQADASATCQKRPEACDLLLAPVCGCDGKDYSNACVANAAGTGVMSNGECSQP